jgi:lysophosphatidylcholine acyltransferase/lyso-PAF acetyltransferase
MKGYRKIFKKLFIWIGKAMIVCFGFNRIKVYGKRASKNEATIFVAAPHSSFFDVFLLAELGLPCIVSKSENIKVPIFGLMLQAIQPILVSRSENLNRPNEYKVFIINGKTNML